MATVTADHTHIAAAGVSLSSREAVELLANNGQLVDVRSPAEFDRNGLPGAVNLPLDAISWRYRSLKRWQPVILYSNNIEHCYHAAVLLAGEGFTKIYYLTPDRAGVDSDA
jgi:rhodanese-related sulfurtransferase